MPGAAHMDAVMALAGTIVGTFVALPGTWQRIGTRQQAVAQFLNDAQLL